MRATVSVNTASFDAAFKEYYETTKKDAAYCVNRAALNVAIKAGQKTPVADVGAIKNLPEKPWWPKLVAKKLSGSGVRLGKTPKRFKGRRYIRGRYTVQEAREASKKIVRGRVARAGYIKSGWLPAINRLSLLKLGSGKGNIGTVPRFSRKGGKSAPGYVREARPGLNPQALIVNEAKGAAIVGAPALDMAYGLAAEDMRQFIRETYGATARKYSAK